MPTVDDPQRFVARLNSAWQTAQWEALAAMYHIDAVLIPPDLEPVISGRDAILATYQEFADRATLLHFDTLGIRAHAFDRTTIVHTDFQVDYSVDGDRAKDDGQEIYVLQPSQNAAGWVIVWRQQIVRFSQAVTEPGAGAANELPDA